MSADSIQAGAGRAAGAEDAYDDGRLRVEHGNYYAVCDGLLLRLPRKEFLIFSRLARGAGRVVPADLIWRHAWGDAAPFNPLSLHAQIYRLRRRLRPHGISIETMINVGYRMIPPPAASGEI